MRAMVKDAKDALITADRSGKAGHTSQSPISSYMNRTCCVCCGKKYLIQSREKGRDDIYISGWCSL